MLDERQVFLEPTESLTVIAVACVSFALEGSAQADGCHVERARLCCRIADKHILYALGTVDGSACVEVNLQIGQRLERSLDLYVLHCVGRSRSGHIISAEEPVTLLRRLNVVVADKTEREIETRAHDAAEFALSKHITYIRHESRQREGISVAEAYAYVAQHHQETCSCLRPLVPFLVFEFRLGNHVDA